MAIESTTDVERRLGKIYTEIRPADTFYLAEAYHQKYYLRNVPVVERELVRTYPVLEDMVGSKAVARANGYVGGHGSQEQFEAELPKLGLSPEAQRELRSVYERYRK